jgi:hemerythrin-like domain-containing protein
MDMAHEMQRLRAEHAALDTLSRFLLTLVAEPDPPRATELASVRGMFRDTLVRHLKCEDWALYPRLKASGDPYIAQLARDFIFEMGHIADEFAAYEARWPAERVAGEWAGFRAETEAVLGAIAMRIEREEDELYPVAEQYDEPSLRRAARH